MAARKKITCITRTNKTDFHEHISHVGSAGWKDAAETAIRNIENGYYGYYVLKGGHDVKVVVASRNGRKYLKTENDGDSPDNLLRLPECK